MASIGVSAEWGMYVAGLPGVSLAGSDYAHFAVTSGAVVMLTDTPAGGVALPSSANCAYIVVEDAPVRIRTGAATDATSDPTTSEGVKWFADTPHPFENQRGFLENLKLIAISSTAKVTVLWGRI